jgi:hypothetical protein
VVDTLWLWDGKEKLVGVCLDRRRVHLVYMRHVMRCGGACVRYLAPRDDEPEHQRPPNENARRQPQFTTTNKRRPMPTVVLSGLSPPAYHPPPLMSIRISGQAGCSREELEEALVRAGLA